MRERERWDRERESMLEHGQTSASRVFELLAHLSLLSNELRFNKINDDSRDKS